MTESLKFPIQLESDDQLPTDVDNKHSPFAPTVPITGPNYHKPTRTQAQQMYYSGFYVTEIVEHLNIDILELTELVFGKDGTGTNPHTWAYKRLNRPQESIVSYQAVKPLILRRAEAGLIERVTASVQDMKDKNTLMDVQDIDAATKTIERLDRITRLEEGKATQNIAIERKSYTLREISEMNNKRDLSNPPSGHADVDVSTNSGNSDTEAEVE